MIDEKLKDYATKRQAEIIDAINREGSTRKAADALEIKHGAVDSMIRAVRRKAAAQGYAPAHDMTREVPDGFTVKGVSTLYDAEGNISAQWVKSIAANEDALEALTTFIEWLSSDAKGKSPFIHAPTNTTEDLLCVYPMGDPHFGMHAWAKETGADFNLELAEALTCNAIDRLVSSAPPADTAILVNLGDFFHADDSTNATPRGKNVLDVDSRWAKIMQIGLRAMIYTIEKTLERHKKVIVRNVAGNHDPHAHFGLALALDAYFNNNPRVTVDLSPATFWFYEFGRVLIGATHGDTIKEGSLPGVMATDRPKAWGRTSFRYWYCGHIHHSNLKEYPGVVVEYFRTLAARDAWHSGRGYRSGRDMRCLVLHKDFGEVERHRCDIAMIDPRALSPKGS